MNWKKTAAIGSAIGLGVFFLWKFFHAAPAPLPLEPVAPRVAETRPAPTVTRAITPPVNAMRALPPSARPTTPYSEKPQDNIIEFQVVNGLAIAYGDVLLGRVEPGFESNRGHYEAPTPQHWERPEIPYAVNPDLPKPERVTKALEYLHKHTPVRFVPYEGQRDAIVFEPDPEQCLSIVGRAGGLQPIRLGENCGVQQVLHEILHALGFIHEQSRPDRDRYVEILWDNIELKYQSQFAIVPDTFLAALGNSPFDYNSVMLYEPNAFAFRDDVLTIRSRSELAVAPVRDGLSASDIRRIRRLYGLYE